MGDVFLLPISLELLVTGLIIPAVIAALIAGLRMHVAKRLNLPKWFQSPADFLVVPLALDISVLLFRDSLESEFVSIPVNVWELSLLIFYRVDLVLDHYF